MIEHLDVDYVPYHEKHMLHTARYHNSIIEDNDAMWLHGNKLVSVQGTPVLLRLDAEPFSKEEMLLEDVLIHGNSHPWAEGGIKRIHTGAGYTGASFGTAERKEIRRRMGTGRTQFSYQYPEFTAVMEELVKVGWENIKKYGGDFYYQVDSADRARKEWRIGNTPYTSGVINSSVTMPYHRDRGNVEDTGSVMWVARTYTKGGHLHIPELNMVVCCSHGTMLAFYGEIFWHGVTLIRGLSRDQASRYSIVAYAKKAILKAKAPEDEHKDAMLRGTKSFDHIRETAIKHE